jgi:hypothetical protein
MLIVFLKAISSRKLIALIFTLTLIYVSECNADNAINDRLDCVTESKYSLN